MHKIKKKRLSNRANIKKKKISVFDLEKKNEKVDLLKEQSCPLN